MLERCLFRCKKRRGFVDIDIVIVGFMLILAVAFFVVVAVLLRSGFFGVESEINNIVVINSRESSLMSFLSSMPDSDGISRAEILGSLAVANLDASKKQNIRDDLNSLFGKYEMRLQISPTNVIRFSGGSPITTTSSRLNINNFNLELAKPGAILGDTKTDINMKFGEGTGASQGTQTTPDPSVPFVPVAGVPPNKEVVVESFEILNENHGASCCGAWIARVYKWLGYGFRYEVISKDSIPTLTALKNNYGVPIGFDDNRKKSGHALILLGIGEEANYWLEELSDIPKTSKIRNRNPQYVADNEALVISYSGTEITYVDPKTGQTKKDDVVYLDVYPANEKYSSFVANRQNSQGGNIGSAWINHIHEWLPLCEGDYVAKNEWSNEAGGDWTRGWDPNSEYYPTDGSCPIAA